MVWKLNIVWIVYICSCLASFSLVRVRRPYLICVLNNYLVWFILLFTIWYLHLDRNNCTSIVEETFLRLWKMAVKVCLDSQCYTIVIYSYKIGSVLTCYVNTCILPVCLYPQVQLQTQHHGHQYSGTLDAIRNINSYGWVNHIPHSSTASCTFYLPIKQHIVFRHCATFQD